MKEDHRINIISNNIKTVIGFYDRFFVLGISILICLACEQRTELINEKLYDGPIFEMDSVFTKLSDSAKIIMTLRASKERSFENQDREWPNDLFLEYLDSEGKVKTTFQADYVYYTAKEDLYRAEGNVVVNNIENGDQLNTELLFWDPRKETFYTDRFVTIQSEDEIHTGEGLDANQDFSYYKIMEPSGTISVQDN
ncbi:MAG: LPS export ABC transporter periplasmic protein LptC [Cyclobacteriaceae bacterium]